ncbi:putative U2 small nuclear ribonucleoprotein Aprime [Diplonema papillatum]|nr:putative U2 small nuclear ribonucleoprotein Aprime [Diplonema papillatum]
MGGQELCKVADGLTALTSIAASSSVTILDVSHNEIESLEGLAQFPSLEILTLDNNPITTLAGMPVMKNLKTLWLNNCLLDDTDATLQTLIDAAPRLRFLSLLGNPMSKSELSGASADEASRYRLYTLYKIPSLSFLDATPVTPTERENAVSKGRYLKIARPAVVVDSEVSAPEANKHLEAAQTRKQAPTFGKQRRFYTGKFSEGNRFIRDDAL